MLLSIIIGALLFGVMNRIRGCTLREIGIGTSGNGAFIAAIALGIFTYVFSLNEIAALTMVGAYILGELWGWTKYINNIPGILTQDEYNARWLLDDTGKTNGNHAITQLLVDETEHYWLHSMIGMAIRGLYWWIPVFGVLLGFQLIGVLQFIAAVIGLSAVFPFVYYFAYKNQSLFSFGPKNLSVGYLPTAEILYGIIYGAVIGAMF